MRLRGNWPLRAVALRLTPQTYAVYSPLPSAEAAQALAARGAVASLIVANKYHHLGLRPFLEAFATVNTIAAPDALKRLSRKNLAVAPLETISLPAGTELLSPPGLKNGEVWLSVAAHSERAWIVGDAFFNVPAASVPGGITGLMLRATRTVPGLRVGKTWNWAAVADWSTYRDWVYRELDTNPPDVLIPCHGDVLRGDDLATRLRRVLDAPGAAA